MPILEHTNMSFHPCVFACSAHFAFCFSPRLNSLLSSHLSTARFGDISTPTPTRCSNYRTVSVISWDWRILSRSVAREEEARAAREEVQRRWYEGDRGDAAHISYGFVFQDWLYIDHCISTIQNNTLDWRLLPSRAPKHPGSSSL